MSAENPAEGIRAGRANRFRPTPGCFDLALEMVAMTKFRKPFYRADRRLWYVQLDGKQLNPGSDLDQAFERCHAPAFETAVLVLHCDAGGR
jgi:hypothetical protein